MCPERVNVNMRSEWEPNEISPAQRHFRDVVNHDMVQVGLINDRQHVIGAFNSQSHKTRVLHDENLVLHGLSKLVA